MKVSLTLTMIFALFAQALSQNCPELGFTVHPKNTTVYLQ